MTPAFKRWIAGLKADTLRKAYGVYHDETKGPNCFCLVGSALPIFGPDHHAWPLRESLKEPHLGLHPSFLRPGDSYDTFLEDNVGIHNDLKAMIYTPGGNVWSLTELNDRTTYGLPALADILVDNVDRISFITKKDTLHAPAN